MARLLVHVEGKTEEDFVNYILQDYLVNAGFETVSARIVGNNRLRRRRGGIRPWPSVRRDIINHLRQDAGCIATTMVDYYGLPHQGDRGWPGRAEATHLQTREKAQRVEEALLDNIAEEIGSGFDRRRFVPFVVMHEFEGLLFADCAAFGESIGRPDMEPYFRRIREAFKTPEDINDSPDTAPSKRVEDLIPNYEKPLLGVLAVLEIGLTQIRAECPHFDAWLSRLESLARRGR